jgi:predicted small integral membrane protein
MRVLKSLLVACIGVTALLYAVQNLANVDDMRAQMRLMQAGAEGADAFFHSNSPALSWAAFAVAVLFQFVIAAVALKGAWHLFAARKGTAEEFKDAKTVAVWAGGLSLLAWFALFLMTGGGLFQWGSDSGQFALTKAFELGTTSALTILFVWGTTD